MNEKNGNKQCMYDCMNLHGIVRTIDLQCSLLGRSEILSEMSYLVIVVNQVLFVHLKIGIAAVIYISR